MIPTAIGIGSRQSAARTRLQKELALLGLQPYFPQLATERTYNIWRQWDDEAKMTRWKPKTAAVVSEFENPLLFSYNRYFYSSRPDTLTFAGKSQDAITPLEMADIMADVRRWMAYVGIVRPWLLVDEPPHAERFGLTEAVEERVITFTVAAGRAGWEVGIASPNPSHLAFWARRVRASRWILNTKHQAAEWKVGRKLAKDKGTQEFWLYNARDFYVLPAQMREYGASGYLHWSAFWKQNPTHEQPGANLSVAVATPGFGKLLNALIECDRRGLP